MLLYYCTICSLYPSLYSRGLPSTCSISSIENEDDPGIHNRIENSSESNNGAELETTSEGLSDYVSKNQMQL